MKRIPLSNLKFALVDDEDFKWLSLYKCFSCGGGGKYAGFCKKVNGKWKTFLIHREVMKAKKGQIIDHINRNPLDCRKKNLRFVSHRDNILNSSVIERAPIGKRGTYLDRRRGVWNARIRILGGTRIHLGSFKARRLASVAYESALKKYHNDRR